jgi:DNA-binding NarL/FixJ family response regulator
VLVADDCPDMLDLLLCELRGQFSIHSAVPNGRQLVEAALSRRPDVIVSDVNMPVLGGVGAMRALQDCGLNTPFVMVSADLGCVPGCLAAGAAGFVFKADAGTELVAAVLAVLDGRLYVSSSARGWHTGRSSEVS